MLTPGVFTRNASVTYEDSSEFLIFLKIEIHLKIKSAILGACYEPARDSAVGYRDSFFHLKQYCGHTFKESCYQT